MNIFAVSSMITAITTILLGSFVLFKNIKNKQNRVWFFVSCAIFIWTFSLFWCFQDQTASQALFWQKMLYLGTTLIPITFYYYSCLLTGKEKKNRILLIIGSILAVLFIVLSFFTEYLVVGIVPRNSIGYWAVTFTPIYYFYLVYFVYYVISSVLILKKGIRENEGIKKNQIRFVYYAALVGFIGGSFNFLLDFGINYPIGNLFVFLYTAFITYAITRYRLMDIRSLVKRSSVFTLLVFLITAVIAMISVLVGLILESVFSINYRWPTYILTALILVAIFEPVRNFLERITDRFLFAKGYNPADLLSQINEKTFSIVSFDKLVASVSEILVSAFHCRNILVSLIDSDGKLNLSYQSGFDLKVVKPFLAGKEKVLSTYFSDSHSIQVIDELKAKFEMGEYQPKDKELLFGLYNLNIALVIPLFVQKRLIGIMTIGNKKSGDPYSQEDIKVLKIAAGSAAIGIENARLYKEVSDFNKNLKQQVNQQTKEIKLKNNNLEKQATHLKKLLVMRSEFLDIASHQLKTPVSVILGTASMFKEGSMAKISKEQQVKFVDNILQKAKKLRLIINDILRASEMDTEEFKLGANVVKPFSLNEVMENLYQEFKIDAEARGLKLVLTKASKEISLIGEEDLFAQAVSNLVDNAIKYTPKGEIKMSLSFEAKEAMIQISDNGIGIPKGDQKKMFDKFARAQNAVNMYTDGSGLGLFIVKKIIEAHGGQISFTSQENKGTIFTIKLPLVKSKKS